MTTAVGFHEGGSWLEPVFVLEGTHVAGIDPGVKAGTIAVLTRLKATGALCGRYLHPTTPSEWVRGLKDLERLEGLRAVLCEDVLPIPPFRMADITLHRNVGLIEGVLWTIDLPWSTIPARDWRASLGLKPEKDYAARKKANAERVRALWPGHLVVVDAVDAAGIALCAAKRRGWITA